MSVKELFKMLFKVRVENCRLVSTLNWWNCMRLDEKLGWFEETPTLWNVLGKFHRLEYHIVDEEFITSSIVQHTLLTHRPEQLAAGSWWMWFVQQNVESRRANDRTLNERFALFDIFILTCLCSQLLLSVSNNVSVKSETYTLNIDEFITYSYVLWAQLNLQHTNSLVAYSQWAPNIKFQYIGGKTELRSMRFWKVFFESSQRKRHEILFLMRRKATFRDWLRN